MISKCRYQVQQFNHMDQQWEDIGPVWPTEAETLDYREQLVGSSAAAYRAVELLDDGCIRHVQECQAGQVRYSHLGSQRGEAMTETERADMWEKQANLLLAKLKEAREVARILYRAHKAALLTIGVKTIVAEVHPWIEESESTDKSTDNAK